MMKVKLRSRSGNILISDLSQRTIFMIQLERCLRHIFAKYATGVQRSPSQEPSFPSYESLKDAYLSDDGLDAWAKDTNGQAFTQETKDEILEFLDLTDDGKLT